VIAIPIPPELLDYLRVRGTYLVVSHVDPDGDCIGSSLAFGHFLSRLGNTVHLLNCGPFDRTEIAQYASMFSATVPSELQSSLVDARVVVLDASTIERIGDLQSTIAGLPTAVIDHHSSGQPFGDVRMIDAAAPSTSYLIQQIIEALGYSPDKVEAEYLLFALVADTGFFRFLDERSSEVFASTARLVSAGASPSNTYFQMYGGHSIESRKMLATLLRRTRTYCNGKLLVVWKTRRDTRLLGGDGHDSASLYQLLMTTRECKVIVYLRDVDGRTCTGSLRSANSIDVGQIAKVYGGGGHSRAAGFHAHRPMRVVRNELVATFSSMLCDDQ